MQTLLQENNLKGPINYLFDGGISRFKSRKKKTNNNYNMSANVPRIKVETEDNSRHNVKIKNPTKINGVQVVEDSDNESSASGSTVEPANEKIVSTKKEKTNKNLLPSKLKSKDKFSPEDYQSFINNSKTKSEISKPDSEYSSEYSDEYSDSGSDNSVSDGDEHNEDKKTNKKEKQEILLKLLALEKKGIELTKKFSMNSKLSELKLELDMHKNSAELDVSVKFQQKILMAAVTGLEFANKKFDPLGAKLDGWSESVMDNLDDYEAIFEKLHEKYKERADLPPELQLLVTLVGSAFMFHVTKTMFSAALPRGIDNLQTSEIMKNISRAMSSNTTPMSTQEISGPSINLSSALNKSMREDDETSSGTVETSKEVTVNAKGKKAINL